MSIENAKAFYERMSTDEAFRTQYQNVTTDDERREFVIASGYNFTPEEWQTAVAEISKSPQGEISDAELEAVSGGIVFPMYGGPQWPGKPGWPDWDKKI